MAAFLLYHGFLGGDEIGKMVLGKWGESEGGFEFCNHVIVLFRGKEFLMGVHGKCATPLEAIFVLGDDVHVAMLPRIAIRAIVHLIGVENLMDSGRHMPDVVIERIHLVLTSDRSILAVVVHILDEDIIVVSPLFTLSSADTKIVRYLLLKVIVTVCTCLRTLSNRNQDQIKGECLPNVI